MRMPHPWTGTENTRRRARSSNQRAAFEPLQDAEWGAFGLHHCAYRQKERLLQHVLTRHGRMRRLIREADPGAAGRERHRLLRTCLLIVEIRLHAVVQ